MTRNSTKYNTIVGIKDGAIYVLKEVFQYGDGMKGACGYSMIPLTQDEIDYRSESQNLRDIWVDAVRADDTDEGLESFVDDLLMNLESDQYYPFDDNSYRYEFNQLLEDCDDGILAKIEEHFGIRDEDYVDWQISSCGRCFDPEDEWDEVFNPRALEIIKPYEKKEN